MTLTGFAWPLWLTGVLTADATLTTALGGAKVYAQGQVPTSATPPWVTFLSGRTRDTAYSNGARGLSRAYVDVFVVAADTDVSAIVDIAQRVYTLLHRQQSGHVKFCQRTDGPLEYPPEGEGTARRGRLWQEFLITEV